MHGDWAWVELPSRERVCLAETCVGSPSIVRSLLVPRFTLHQPQSRPGSPVPPSPSSTASFGGTPNDLPPGLRTDPRITIIDELPRLLLIECPAEAAAEWLAKMPEWKLAQERRVQIPDPRPKLKRPPAG
jgi:hypothetical protein